MINRAKNFRVAQVPPRKLGEDEKDVALRQVEVALNIRETVEVRVDDMTGSDGKPVYRFSLKR